MLLDYLCITVKITGIAFKVLGGTELHRIYEIRYDCSVVISVRSLDKACVALVEISHCGYEADCKALLSPLSDLCSYFIYSLYNLHFTLPP